MASWDKPLPPHGQKADRGQEVLHRLLQQAQGRADKRQHQINHGVHRVAARDGRGLCRVPPPLPRVCAPPVSVALLLGDRGTIGRPLRFSPTLVGVAALVWRYQNPEILARLGEAPGLLYLGLICALIPLVGAIGAYGAELIFPVPHEGAVFVAPGYCQTGFRC